MLVRRWVLLCLIFALGGAAQTGNKGVKVSPRDAAQFQTEKKLALIVGINDYQEESGLSKLKYAVSDAEELATALQSYGYLTDVLTDSRAMTVPESGSTRLSRSSRCRRIVTFIARPSVRTSVT